MLICLLDYIRGKSYRMLLFLAGDYTLPTAVPLLRPRLSLQRYALVVCLSTAALVGVILAGVSHTDRGRQNVIQVLAVLFLVFVTMREGKAYFGKIGDDERPDRGPGVWVPILVGAAVWAPMVSLYFIGDDFEHLAWSRAPFFDSVWDLARHGQEGTFLRPIASATIFLEYRLWGTWPDGYHITNLAIHLTGVAGLFYLCRRLRFGSQGAAIASLIYAVLPIEVEAVAWMGARFDLMSACLSIWTAFFYVHFRQTSKPAVYVAALLCFFFALLSKENSYLFPFILLVAEYLMMPRRSLKAPAGFFVLSGVLFLYRWLILGGIGGYRDPSGQRIALHLDFKILQGLFIRDPALLLFGYNWSEPRLSTTILITAVTSAALLLTASFYKPVAASWRRTAFCLSWIVLPLLPIHPLLLIKPDLSNSRILYFSSAGMAMLIGHLLARSRATRDHGRADARTRWGSRRSARLRVQRWNYTQYRRLALDYGAAKTFPIGAAANRAVSATECHV